MFPKIILKDLRKFPVKKLNSNQQKPFIALVDNMLELNKTMLVLSEKFAAYFKESSNLEAISRNLENWHELEFGEFIKELNKAIKKTNRERAKEGMELIKELTKKDEFEWMELFEENKKKAVELQQQIDETDRKIDQMVYELYGLTDEEIQIVENS